MFIFILAVGVASVISSFAIDAQIGKESLVEPLIEGIDLDLDEEDELND